MMNELYRLDELPARHRNARYRVHCIRFKLQDALDYMSAPVCFCIGLSLSAEKLGQVGWRSRVERASRVKLSA
jgi:hypothetical protein